MPIVFNPGYIGPNPPCCDTDCTHESECPNAECGPCSGMQLPCGGCSPAFENGRKCTDTDDEVCNNSSNDPPSTTPKTINK